ncbi:MAG: phosphatidylinositol kinase [Chitinophagaceae bacterium]|nr:phosphatidylinositol kinase [Chitinophagaceae bacterium]
MERAGNVFYNSELAGRVWQDEHGYWFQYEAEYVNNNDSMPISLTLPKRYDAYDSPILFPFFDGLIPEGWLLGFVVKNWKVERNDRMGLLLVACKDCIGAVSVVGDE